MSFDSRAPAARWRLGAIFLAGCVVAGLSGCSIERPLRYDLKTNYSVADPQFARVAGSLLGPQLVPGNSVHTLRNGDEIFPAMLQAIAAAQKTITFETYVYWKGSIGDQFTAAFCQRAQAGVKIHLLIDAVGSDKIDRSYLKRLRQAGCEVHEYHAFHVYDPSSWGLIDHRTHRKIMVVDGRIGFTGGVGIADEWLGNGNTPGQWRDNHYRVEGPVVAQLQSAFLDNWMQSTGKVLDRDSYFPALVPAGQDSAQVFRSSYTGGSENVQLML
ncbi:MAG TPA: phospholipase D-like domain-containing protein, partial [Tepidisphaeraceae bacterium]|nr:phospholipase D-like domain-containing protein [Tepidisphaeraceae bacterium]